MRCSVIIPMYNASKTISTCLEALLPQCQEDIEVIVVDDASTDDSLNMVKRFSGVTYVRHSRNKGPSASRNTGVDKAQSDILVFIDADTILREKALNKLIKPLEENASILGTNGIFALDNPAEGRTTAFVNTSIHFQHIRHGQAVNTAFTAICALRRSAFNQMGGWDNRRQSRYADDINTRWHLPDGCIHLIIDAQADHLKNVSLQGLLKHRFNIGYHFIHALRDNANSVGAAPQKSTLHSRYPINTIVGIGLLAGIIFPPIWAPLLGIGLLNNASFVLFTYRHRCKKEAILAAPLSLIEGVAYGLGVLQGGRHKRK